MSKKYLFIATVLLLIINLSALATIGFHRLARAKESVPACYRSGDDYLQQELELTPSQMQQMQAIKTAFQSQAGIYSDQLFERRSELVAQLKADRPDSERINQLLQEIAALQTELQQQVIRSVLQQKAILNLEQQERFFALLKERLVYESRCQHASERNPFDNNCNANYNQP